MRNEWGEGAASRFFLPFTPQTHTLCAVSATIDIKYVAHLARLELTSEEEQTYGAQLGQILDYIDKLRELDVSQAEAMSHAVRMVNVTRPDDVEPGLSNEESLRNAPSHANGLFMVPKIVE